MNFQKKIDKKYSTKICCFRCVLCVILANETFPKPGNTNFEASNKHSKKKQLKIKF